ncbi:TPM domain-containing protein [Tsukamurella sputi]|uniref:TPM domain-containing protein n=1 Tax=Tsukamurella sputi TaxID=2591848 RepID=A0A5C5RIM1_9ACTN|nr:TPM domain-containing protein [Tsukamurella sputi]TWS22857.1 TPM domain-containing protein [Tsukamurella sputi]
MKRIFAILVAAVLALLAGTGVATADPAGVVDRAGLFGDRAADVEVALDDFQSRTGMVGTVVTANGIGGQDIRAFATTAGAVLGRDRGEAVVIGVDLQTRKVGVYTTPAAMARIPDAEITRLIGTVITPPFRGGDYANGVVAGLRGLADVATGGAATTTAPTTVQGDGIPDTDGLVPGGSTITVEPGYGTNRGTYTVTGPGWPNTEKSDDGPPGIFIAFIVLIAVGGVVSMVVSGSRDRDADTPELRSQLADLVAAEPGYATWSNRRRFAHAQRHTGVRRGTWNSIYPDWRVSESDARSGSSSSGGFFGGGGSSSSFSSDSGSGSSGSSGGFSGGGGSSGSF